MTNRMIDDLPLETVLALWIFGYLDATAVILYLLKRLQAQPGASVEVSSLALSLASLHGELERSPFKKLWGAFQAARPVVAHPYASSV